MKSLLASCFILLICSNAYGQKLSEKTKTFLKAQMDSISVRDQKYRWQLMLGEFDAHKLDSLKNLSKDQFWNRVAKVNKHEEGFSTLMADSLWNLQNYLDSINIGIFYSIVKKYGYPSYQRVKSFTSSSFSLHIMGDKYFNTFFELFKKEAEKGNMPPNEYAMWYDRNQLVFNKKQLYGAYDEVYPCVDNLELTNKERRKIGLPPLQINNCK